MYTPNPTLQRKPLNIMLSTYDNEGSTSRIIKK